MVTPIQALKDSISHFVMANAERILMDLGGIPWMVVSSAEPLTPLDIIVSPIPEPTAEYLAIAVRAIQSRHVLTMSIDPVNETWVFELREDCGDLALAGGRFAAIGDPDQATEDEIAAIAARFLKAVELHLNNEHAYPADSESTN